MLYAWSVSRASSYLASFLSLLAACTPPPSRGESAGGHESKVVAAAPKQREVDAQWCGEVWDHVFQLALDEISADLSEAQLREKKLEMAGERDNFLSQCKSQGTPEQLMCLQAAEVSDDIFRCGGT